MSQGGAQGVHSRPVAPKLATSDSILPVHRPQSDVAAIPSPDWRTWQRYRLASLVDMCGAAGRTLRNNWAIEVAHGRHFLLMPVFLGLGVIVWFTSAQDPPVWIAALGPPSLFAGLALSRAGRSVAAHSILCLSFVLCGMGLAAIETQRKQTIMLDSPVTAGLTGVVERREAAGQGRWRYEIRLSSTEKPVLLRPPERVAVLARDTGPPIDPGQMISGLARLSPPSGPALPGLADFGFASYFDGIGAIGYFYGKPVSEAAAPQDQTFSARMALFALRGAIGDRIRSIVPGDAGAFAAAIVTDERRAISRETLEALRLSGLAHIVAISGLNMALAAGIFFVGVRFLLSLSGRLTQSFPIKKIAAAGALLMATAYYLISGFGVSAERAYLMMAIMLVAVFFDRPSISLHNVALAALFILVISPSELLGASFQMSFAATAALIGGYAAWTTHRSRRPDEWGAPHTGVAVSALRLTVAMVVGTAATSLIGGRSTAIFTVSHFHQVTGYGLVANLAAMPLISLVVMPSGLVGMLLMPFGLDAPFFRLMGYALELVISVAKLVASWGGELSTGRTHPWFLGLAVVGFLILVLMRTRLRLFGLPFLIAALLLFGRPEQQSSTRLVITEDGTVAGLIEARTASVNRRRPPDFVYRQWVNALRIEETLPPEEHLPAELGLDLQDADGEAASRRREPLSAQQLRVAEKAFASLATNHTAGRFACITKIACLARTQEGVVIVLIEDARFAGAGCDVADIVISAFARFDICRSGALMLNGSTLRRTGALEIDFRLSRDRAAWQTRAAVHTRDRAWTASRAYDWRSRSFDKSLPEPVNVLLKSPLP